MGIRYGMRPGIEASGRIHGGVPAPSLVRGGKGKQQSEGKGHGDPAVDMVMLGVPGQAGETVAAAPTQEIS